jgi:hypothetical protein
VILLVYFQRGFAETPRGGGLRDESDTVKILVTGRGALFARGPLGGPAIFLPHLDEF